MKTYRDPMRSSKPKAEISVTRNVHWKHRKRASWVISMAVAMAVALVHSTTFITSASSTTSSSSASSSSSSSMSNTPPAHQSQSQQHLKPSTTHHHHLQHHPTSQSPAAVPNEPHAINLIPVDQPMLASSTVDQDQRSSNSKPDASLDSQADAFDSTSSFRPSDAVDTIRAELNPSPEMLGNGRGELEEELAAEFHNGDRLYINDSGGISSLSQHDKSSRPADSLDSYHQVPLGQVSAYEPAASGSSKSPQQLLERRFGMFKKQHYGTPMMSANYASAPAYLTDCERCLASYGQSGDLQQIEPIPVTIPQPLPSIQPIHVPPPPPPPPLPSQSYGSYSSPLKNKLFMKFPFFMKSPMVSSFGDSGPQTGPSYAQLHEPPISYWPHHYGQPTTRPQLSSAVYLRPASAYNCIQASAPLISASGHHQEAVSLAAATKGQVKQYSSQQPQQQTYSNSQY